MFLILAYFAWKSKMQKPQNFEMSIIFEIKAFLKITFCCQWNKIAQYITFTVIFKKAVI